MDMDVDVPTASTSTSTSTSASSPTSMIIPRDAEGNLDLSSVPYTAENWNALLHTPPPASLRSRSGSLAAPSTHTSSPFPRRATFPEANFSQHAETLPIWLAYGPASAPLPPAGAGAAPRTAQVDGKAEHDVEILILPASAVDSPTVSAPKSAVIFGEQSKTAAAAAVGSDDSDDDDDGSYHPEEDDDEEDRTSDISSAPPSPGIPEAARELERRYLASQQTTPQRSAEPTPTSARPPPAPPSSSSLIPELNKSIISVSDMSFTHDALSSPSLPSSATSSRPSLRIDTGVQQPEAPFTSYPAIPEWARQQQQQQHTGVQPPLSSMLGLSMDTARDSKFCSSLLSSELDLEYCLSLLSVL